MLQILIESVPDGLEAALIQKRMHAQTALDQVAGEPEYVMRVVTEWLQVTENLTTTKDI
jgi:hypothetical protein